MNERCTSPWLPALLLLFCIHSFAATIYKSIDENGIVSYSDTRPPEGILLETVEIRELDSPPGGQEQQRLQDMRETTDRMVADRMAREKHRAEMRQLAAKRDSEQASQQAAQYSSNAPLYAGYNGYPFRPPWRHPHYPHPHYPHPRPEHPIAHPPLRPPVHNRPPGVRPLPGNDYPASLIRKSYDPKVREAFR